MILGAVDGIMFGAMDVEDDRSDHPKLRKTLVWSLVIGVILGALLGFFNEWIRIHAKKDREYRPVRPDTSNTTAAATGYEDI